LCEPFLRKFQCFRVPEIPFPDFHWEPSSSCYLNIDEKDFKIKLGDLCGAYNLANNVLNSNGFKLDPKQQINYHRNFETTVLELRTILEDVCAKSKSTTSAEVDQLQPSSSDASILLDHPKGEKGSKPSALEVSTQGGSKRHIRRKSSSSTFHDELSKKKKVGRPPKKVQ
jgi:hypothetical protein